MTEQRVSRSVWLRLACILPGAALMLLAWVDVPMIGGGPGLGLFDGAVLAFGAVTAAAGFLPRRYLANYLAFFAMTMLTLALAEVVLQNTVRGRYFSANDFDERVLFKLRPGATHNFTHLPINGGETITFRVNPDGFVGPDLQPVGTRQRILVYGDSFTHAEFSHYEQRFTTRLQEELGARLGRGVEVINAGIAGYGPDQVLRRIETEVPALAPDLVIVNVFAGNDFGDLLRNRLYRLDANGKLVENAYVLSPEQKRRIALNRYELVLFRVLKDARDKIFGRKRGSATDNFDPEAWINRAYDQQLREYREFVVQGDNTVGEFSVDPYSADISTSPENPSSRYKIAMMGQIFEKIRDETEAAGTRLLVVVIPHPMDLLGGDHASGRIDRAKFPGYEPTRLTDTMSGIAAGLGIPYVNLYGPFAAADPNALYLKGGDDHWNGAGQALAAKLVADTVIGAGLLTKRSGTAPSTP
jgi:hypothetical protein